MGNDISYVNSEVQSVEEYLSQIPNLQCERKISATRFLRTVEVRATDCDYPLLAKLFVIPNNLNNHPKSLDEYKVNITRIRDALENCPNALSFAQVEIHSKFAIILRQYVKYSLYDRISTRPFLTTSEKKWIAFQLLCGLAQCHRAEVCHGDIKLTNILVTGWNWVVLSDFASFKPTRLPKDHPAEFDYYFDSPHKVCYTAPERFYEKRVIDRNREVPEDSREKSPQTDSETHSENLTPAMDIFSLGCVFIEMFTPTGKIPFELSDMLKYIETGEPPTQLLEIKDDGIRELCADMIQKDPKQRKSAEYYIETARSQGIFPPSFYNGLLDFFKLYALDIAHPDCQIFQLYNDHVALFQKIDNCQEGFLVLANFITSMVRSLKHSSAKIVGLKLMKTCSDHLEPSLILDRLLPFVIRLLSDPCPLVVSEAVHKLADILENVQNVPEPNAFVFVDYIIPELERLSRHNNTTARVALAANVGSLATSALRFLETSHLSSSNTSQDDPSNLPLNRSSYEKELGIILAHMQHIVGGLITDHCNQVKRMLLTKGANKLCIFFGQERANDILLSHMVTFLNDSSDHEMRCCFFQTVVGIATFIGTSVNQILVPLIEQGFKDPHDAVVCSALMCVTSLTEIRFFRHSKLCELFKCALVLLGHRNTWIRVEAAQFLACVARNVPLALKESRLRGELLPLLECPVVQMEKPEVIIGLAKIINQERSSKQTISNDLEIICIDERKSKQIKDPKPFVETEAAPKSPEGCEAVRHYSQLQRLFYKRKKLAEDLRDVETNDSHFSQAWKPKGTLMAHMHEHQRAINKICVMPDGLFATCSSDGTVKLWDWNRVEKRTMTNKSFFTYPRLTGELTAMDYCNRDRAIMVASNSGNMEVLSLGQTELKRIDDRIVDPTEDGWTVDIKPVGGSLMAYSTLYGGVYGLDLRKKKLAFSLRNDISSGLIQCMAVHSSKSWLVVGTSEGSIVCYDLRFMIPITQVTHSYRSRVYKLIIPKHSNNGDVWASHLGNNEVTLWNLENQQQAKTLWASTSSPFSGRAISRHVSYAVCQADQYLFTGGTDMRIRCWDVAPNAYLHSYLVTGSALDGDRIHASYNQQMCDGIEVLQETLLKPPSTDSKLEQRMGSRTPAGHNDCITDLALIKTQRHFLISASKNGVVKIWK